MPLVYFLIFNPDAYDAKCIGILFEINNYYDHIGNDNQLMHDVYIDYTAGGSVFEDIAFFEYNGNWDVGGTVSFYCVSEDRPKSAVPIKTLLHTLVWTLPFSVL